MERKLNRLSFYLSFILKCPNTGRLSLSMQCLIAKWLRIITEQPFISEASEKLNGSWSSSMQQKTILDVPETGIRALIQAEYCVAE